MAAWTRSRIVALAVAVLALVSIATPVPAQPGSGNPFADLQRQINDLPFGDLQRQIDVLADAVAGLAGAPIRVTVDCAAGQRIGNALQAPPGPLTITIAGTCVEHVLITRDGVSLVGAPGAGVTAPAATTATSPAILIDTARQVRIANLTVHGGAGGVVGTRNASYDLSDCTVMGATRFGVVASYGAIGTVARCLVSAISGDGLVAANTASLVVTDSIVEGNTGAGLSALRGAHLRIGQDSNGNTGGPAVTVRGNGGNGVTVTESSAAIVVGGSVSGNARNGIFVGRGSSAQIGVGSSGFEAGVLIQSNGADGLFIEGASATILGSTIGGGEAGAGNGRAGIVVTNGGSARIGIRNDSSAYVGNTITNNKRDGITVSSGGSAIIGGNLISNNGQDPTVTFRFGVLVSRATAVFPGGNTISNHPNTGVFAGGGGTVRIGDPGFGLPVLNTIKGNGHNALDGSTRGGIAAFQGGVIETRGAVIEENFGQGGFAFEDGIIELREATVIQFNKSAFTGTTINMEAGHGLVGNFRSTLRLRDAGTAIRNNAGDGVLLLNGSAVDFRGFGLLTPVVVTENVRAGLRCSGAGVFFSGDLRSVTANPEGNISNCIPF
jgi:hypothetical protein